ncbi:MAG TPA: endo-1,4-beta-xylanase [Prolixibacteraceae bacterium]|nr:endo-1,4-beta-xylanase [Prolixibacteraceae bacterium]
MNKFKYLLIFFTFLFAGTATYGQHLMSVPAQDTPTGENSSALQVLGPIAGGNEKFLGCAYSSGQSANFHAYWNQITPENSSKWGSVEGTRNVMRWTEMDAAYNTAKKYGMLFKQHPLLWGAQQPAWMATLDTASQRMEIEQWFSLMAARYPDMEYIDVVNEPLHNAPNGMLPWGATTKNIDYAKALGGAGATGWDWIITAFRMARKHFPNSKLILNEYSVINSSTETQKYIKIIKLLQADSLIDGIGEQAHAFTTATTDAATLKANLDALGATGVPIYLTEMDVDGMTDLAQLKEMQRIFPLFWNHPAVKGITFWGFRVGLWRNDQKAYLINQNGTERPAMRWLKAFVNDTLVKTQSITVTASNGSSTVKKVGETLSMTAQVLPANTTIPNVTWSVSPVGRATIDSNGLLKTLATGNVIVTATSWDGSGVKGTKIIVVTNETTGIENQNLSNSINVYPNPAVNGKFTVQGIESIKRLELVNLVGDIVKTYHNLKQSSLDIEADVPKGVYVLRFFDDEKSGVKKIVIQ